MEAEEHLIARGPHAVDAHVHLHRCFHLARFLDAASTNASRALSERDAFDARAAVTQVSHPAGLGILLLTEGAGEGAFERLRHTGASAAPWTCTEGSERGTLWLSRPHARLLLVLAGRQVVTAEGVEVLALLSPDAPADGTPLDECLSAIVNCEGVAVLPWGFGKWTGRRGRLVAEQLRGSGRPVMIGDNGGRLAAGPTPALLAEAERRGAAVLPGSDPLPFPDHEQRAGSFGFLADVALPLDRPLAALRAWLGALDHQPDRYGALRGPAAFCWDQGRMQWRKRISRQRPVSR